MKGLLLKDFYMTIKHFRIFFAITLIFLGVSFAEPESMLFLLYPGVLISMLPMSLYAYDESEKWCDYCATLPISRGQYVSAKFLVCLIFTLPTALLEAIAFGLQRQDVGSALIIFCFASSISLVAPALVMPIMFRFGPEKGRIVYYFVIAITCAASTLLNIEDTAALGLSVTALPVVPMLIAAVCIFAISWLLSIKGYQKAKE